MTRRNIWMIIPALLLPYLALFILTTIFLSPKIAFFRYIMESVFNSNALYLIGAFILCCIVTAILTISCFLVGLYKEWDALSLAKIVMIVKLFQIPAYVLIFVLGILLMITIFTIPFSIGLFLFSYFSLFLTGAMVVSAGINSIRQGVFKLKEVLWIMVLQFVFCADVVSSIIFYVKLKNVTDKTNKANMQKFML